MRQEWTRRRFLAVGGGLALGGVALGCSDDDDDPLAAFAPEETTTVPEAELPTNDERELKRIFDPLLEPLGQQVTRIGLYDLSRGFVRDDDGTHMAIYAEPIDPDGEGWDTERYVETVAPGMAAVTPFIFETWSGIVSMDICQEPPQRQAPEPEPPIVTQVFLGRADYGLLDWDDLTLADLIAARLRSPETARVRGDEDAEAHPLWVAAEAEAESLI